MGLTEKEKKELDKKFRRDTVDDLLMYGFAISVALFFLGIVMAIACMVHSE